MSTTESYAPTESLRATREKPRVAIVVSNPIQHFCPLYRAVEESGLINLQVVFLSPKGAQPFFDRQFNQTIRWQAGLLDGFKHTFIARNDPVRHAERWTAAWELWRALDLLQPTVVVNYGFSGFLAQSTLVWVWWRRRKVLQISDSQARHTGTVLQRVRRNITLPLLCRTVSGFLTVGDSNRKFYRDFGAREEVLYYCPFTVDEAPLRQAARHRAEHRRAISDRFGIPDGAFIVLSVGKLNRRKRPADLVGAIELLLDRGVRNVCVIFAGDGAEKDRLIHLSEQRLRPHVHLAGFVPVHQLPSFYVAADVLVQASDHDPHPLSISEALYCGLPIVASTGVGSVGATDDVRLGENGLVFNTGDVFELADHLHRLSSNQDMLDSFRKASFRISEQRNLATSLRGFLKAVERTCQI